jgi:hypothetical protein
MGRKKIMKRMGGKKVDANKVYEEKCMLIFKYFLAFKGGKTPLHCEKLHPLM